jgi:putative CocE/NonD family hydrolase
VFTEPVNSRFVGKQEVTRFLPVCPSSSKHHVIDLINLVTPISWYFYPWTPLHYTMLAIWRADGEHQFMHGSVSHSLTGESAHCFSRFDGVRIAVDVVVPVGGLSNQRFPTGLEMTRYWRGGQGDPVNDEERTFTTNGFAIVIGDVRGTGASSGIWPYHRSRAETLDFDEIITWIARQPWSNGEVLGYGVSYSANTADWMAERGNPALKAIVSRFPDYDPYADLYFPGGVPNRWMAETWGLAVKQMDLGQRHDASGKALPGIRAVDSDADGRLLNKAIQERRNVPSVYEGLKQIRFRDDRPASWSGASMDDWSIFSVRQRIDHFNTPVQTWGSWFDSGVANGVLHRFMTQSYPQRAFIGAWTHGGFRNASPYVPRNAPADPVFAIQMNDDLCFIDRFTNPRGARPLKPRKLLTYYTVGEEHWKTTTVWPIPQAKPESWYFDARNSLSPQKPDGSWGADEYTVDFTATTGRTNRWHTNGGVEEVWYGDRKAEESHSSCNDDVTISCSYCSHLCLRGTYSTTCAL